MEIQFDTVIFKEGKSFVAYCPELDVSSYGASLEEARRMIKEAVSLFLEEAEKMGTLEEILREAGYASRKIKGKKIWNPPLIYSSERMEVRV